MGEFPAVNGFLVSNPGIRAHIKYISGFADHESEYGGRLHLILKNTSNVLFSDLFLANFNF